MRQWAVNFIYCILTLILFSYITPEGKYAKQVKLACSILFIAAVLYPASRVIRQISYGDIFLKNSLYVDDFRYQLTLQKGEESWMESLSDLYAENLEKALTSELVRKTKYEGDVAVSVNMDSSEGHFGEIGTITLMPSGTVDTQSVKKIVSSFYSVPEENIYITESGDINP